ncbi:MAG: hypothetical protein QXX17_03325 [Conexivisphaerales archaeon]
MERKSFFVTRYARDVREAVVFVAKPVAMYLALNLVILVVTSLVAQPSVKIGTLRPVDTIPVKIMELVSVGIVLGIITSLSEKKFDLKVIALATVFVVLLDLDHLPSLFNVQEPIRPDHTLLFLATSSVILYLTGRSSIEVPLISASSFLAHIASDNGIFGLFAPFSFQYVTLNEYDPYLYAGAVILAVIAGRAKVRRLRERPELNINKTNESHKKGV